MRPFEARKVIVHIMNTFMKSVDTKVLGRKSYDVSRRLWARFDSQRTIVMGGGGIIASFLDAQAIDEMVISVVPVFIGDGVPLIAPRHRHVPLELRSVERFDDGVVQLRYGHV